MTTQFGGLKLELSDNKLDNVGFKPIFDMLNHEHSTLKLLTASSLKGFIFILDVPEKVSRYYDLNSDKMDFTQKVTSFIIKCAIVTPTNNEVSLGYYEKTEKMSETPSSFYEEAKLQQFIWRESIIGGRSEICPSVANFSLFKNEQSIPLLELCLKKTHKNPQSSKVFDFLLEKINKNNNFGLGMITMKNYNHSKPLSEYAFSNNPLPDNELNQILSCVIIKVIRLFLLNYIHLDLHSNNILVTFDKSKNKYDCVIIDFGRASRLDSHIKKSKAYNKGQKTYYIYNINETSKILNSHTSYDKNKLVETIKKLVVMLLTIDKINNNYVYNINEPQMDWMTKHYTFINEHVLNDKFISDLYDEMSYNKNSKFTNKNIKEYTRKKSLYNLDKRNTDLHYYTLPKEEEKKQLPTIKEEKEIEKEKIYRPHTPIIKKKCPNGTRKNKITKLCEPKKVQQAPVIPAQLHAPAQICYKKPIDPIISQTLETLGMLNYSNKQYTKALEFFKKCGEDYMIAKTLIMIKKEINNNIDNDTLFKDEEIKKHFIKSADTVGYSKSIDIVNMNYPEKIDESSKIYNKNICSILTNDYLKKRQTIKDDTKEYELNYNERMKHLKKCCQVKDLNSCDSAKETRLVKCIRMNDNYTFYYYTNCYYDLNQKKILISTQILMNTLKIRNKNNNNIKIIENKEEGDIIVVKYEI
jgi:hypothetical protein